MAGMP
jgi:hypothetical protein